MSGAQEFGKTLDELAEQVEELTRVAKAREEALNLVLNTLSEFAFPQRPLNGGDLVEDCGTLYRRLLAMKGLDIDLAPKVVRLGDGSYLTPDGESSDDVQEAAAFFNPPAITPGGELVNLCDVISENSHLRERM